MKRVIKASTIDPIILISAIQDENMVDTVADNINNNIFEVETFDKFKWMVHDQISRWLKEKFNFIGDISKEVKDYIDNELEDFEQYTKPITILRGDIRCAITTGTAQGFDTTNKLIQDIYTNIDRIIDLTISGELSDTETKEYLSAIKAYIDDKQRSL